MSNLLTISYGDQPELMEAALRIMMEAGAVLEIEAAQLGGEMKKLGFDKGFDEEALRKIRCSRVLLMGVNAEVEIADLCAALEIPSAPESFGEGENAALGFVSEGYAIFLPAEPAVRAMLNAAVMMLKNVGQLEAAERIEKALANTFAENSPVEFAELVIGKLYNSSPHEGEPELRK